MANVLDYTLIVNKFKLLLCYYVYFQTNILRKGTSTFILPVIG